MRILFTALLLLSFIIFASAQQNKSKKKKYSSEFSIEGKVVSQKEFDAYIKTLKEIENSWFCAETNTGGRTGYNAKDTITGIIYEYRVESDQEKSRNTIKKKALLELK